MLIGIISDIHEDIKGLEKALKILEKKGSHEIICLGDIAGYSFPHFRHHKKRDASGCLALVRQTCTLVIPGNHDLYACRKTPEANPGFIYPDGWYELDFLSRQKLAGDKIWLYEDTELESNYTESDKEYIASLPEFSLRVIDVEQILFSHYLYPDLSGSSRNLLPDIELIESHLKFMIEQNCKLSFFGHSHVEGLWFFQDDDISRKRKVSLDINHKPSGIGVPSAVNGRNDPGIVTFDTGSGSIESFNLYPALKRFLSTR